MFEAWRCTKAKWTVHVNDTLFSYSTDRYTQLLHWTTTIRDHIGLLAYLCRKLAPFSALPFLGACHLPPGHRDCQIQTSHWGGCPTRLILWQEGSVTTITLTSSLLCQPRLATVQERYVGWSRWASITLNLTTYLDLGCTLQNGQTVSSLI